MEYIINSKWYIHADFSVIYALFSLKKYKFAENNGKKSAKTAYFHAKIVIKYSNFLFRFSHTVSGEKVDKRAFPTL